MNFTTISKLQIIYRSYLKFKYSLAGLVNEQWKSYVNRIK